MSRGRRSMSDVVVVGAGPAGTAAAITLARAGCDVQVLDKARFPRDKCCGDGLTTLALRRLDALGLDAGRVHSWYPVDHLHLRSPAGRTVDLDLPRGRGAFAAVARRTDLDAALVDLARHAGADVVDGSAMRDARQGADHVEVDHDDGTVVARYAIGADGMWSPLRRALGIAEPGYRGDWHAVRRYVRAGGPASRDLWVWFDADLLPGYAWSFPLPDGWVNVGFGAPRPDADGRDEGRLDGAAFADTWRRLLARPHVQEVLGPIVEEERSRAWPIPARLPATRLTHQRALFVGDAAAAADPMTGEGIGQALETGRLAAEAVIGAGAHRPDLAARCYERAARRALAVDHRLAAGLSALLAHRRATELALRGADLNGWTRGNFARWMFEDEPRAAVLTPRRWHRRFLRRAGANLSDPAAPACRPGPASSP